MAEEAEEREPTPEERGDVLPDEHGAAQVKTNEQGTEGQGTEGQGTEGQGTEGQGTEGQGTEGQGTEGQGTEGTEGQGTEGQGTEGQGTEGTEGQGTEGQGEQPGPGWIPRHRYNAVQRRNQELERQLASQGTGGTEGQGSEGQGQGQGSEGAQSGKLETAAQTEQELTRVGNEMAEALKSGETDKAADLQAQQTKLMTQYTQQVSQEVAQQATQSSSEEARYDTRVSEVEQTYPQLNIDANEFDEALAGRITAMRDAYQAQGYAAADALDEALTAFEPLLQPSSQSAGNNEGEGNGAGQQRKEDAVQRNLEAQGKQPPNTQGTGHDSSEHGQGKGVNPAEMPEEEFDALPDDTLKRLRGDDG